MKKKLLLSGILIFLIPLIDAMRHGYVVDDAFITFRYARNLSRGMGLVFNPGERVEGYTNFLWTLLTTQAFLLKVDPLLFSRIFSALAGFGTILLLLRFQGARRRDCGNVTIYLPPLLCASSAPFSIWLLSGMETHLFTVFLTGGILFFLEREKKGDWGWSVLFVLAALTRPEGLLFLVIAWTVSIFHHVRNKETLCSKDTLIMLLPFIAFYLPYLGWKLSYYGAFLPNTFHAKVGSEVNQLWRGIRYLKSFIRMSGGPVFALPVILATSQRGRNLLTGTLPFLIPYLGYVILVGGDSMVKFRFLLPVLPIIYLLVGEAVERAGSIIKDQRKSATVIVAVSVISILLTFDYERPLVHRRKEMVNGWIETGKWLASNYSPDTVIAHGAIGALPYYSDLYTIDIFGLTDPYIASQETEGMGKGLAGHEKADGAYVLSREPDLIFPKVILSEHPTEKKKLGMLFTGSRAEREIWNQPSFHKFYRPVTVKLPGGYLTFFSREDRDRSR